MNIDAGPILALTQAGTTYVSRLSPRHSGPGTTIVRDLPHTWHIHMTFPLKDSETLEHGFDVA